MSKKHVRIRLDFFSNRPDNFTYYGVQGTLGGYEGPRAESEEHKVHIKGETPSRTWQNLWDFEDYLPQSWKQMPSEAIDNSYNGGAPLMIEDFARCIINDSLPPIDVIDAVNMTAPGLMSEISRDNGGAPVEVPSFD